MWLKPDPKSSTPMSVQIRKDILGAIAGLRYLAGDKLPSVRGLASEILVNPNTVAKVYRDLERDGLLESRPGLGMLVAVGSHSACLKELQEDLEIQAKELVEKAQRCGLDGEGIHALVERLLLSQGAPFVGRKNS